jgi:hypothetical protein
MSDDGGSQATNDSDSLPSVPCLVGRFGTAFFAVPFADEDGESLINRALGSVFKALRSDPRVVDIDFETADQDWISVRTFRPLDVDDDADYYMAGKAHFHAINLFHPIQLQIRVPKKNQPKRSESDEIPSDFYIALWDGLTLMVFWQGNVDDRVPLGGGHIVYEVLEDALQKCGFWLPVQGCSSECSLGFAHRPLKLVTGPCDLPAFHGVDDQDASRILVDDDVPSEMALGAWYAISGDIATFAEAKNVARYVMNLEGLARRDLSRLLEAQWRYVSALPSRSSRFGRVLGAPLERVRQRALVRDLVSKMWLYLVNLEYGKREWMQAHAELVRRTADSGAMALFALDDPTDAHRVDTLDTSQMQAAIQHAGFRFENRMLVAATLSSGIFGGLVGAALSSLFG